MDPELLYKQMIARKPHVRENTWNALTILALLATLAIVVVLLVIFNDPAAGINPYPPPAKPAKVGQAAALTTATDLLPTWTLTIEPTAIAATEIPAVPDLSVVKPTTAVIVLEATPAVLYEAQPTSEPVKPGKFAFGLQANPQGISASLYQPTRACAWMGVAGRVFDIQNRPVKGIRVLITGWLNGHTVNLLSLTGTALQYGPSGYEFSLAETPDATSGQLKIQLMDQSDLPLSDVVVLDTYVECEKNLILVDFKQTGLAAGQ
ncbi:MAG TPA: hypothetical protein VN364_04250 [Bellilinea sp.]|nr:hypothetical protein [Bellilinea sp.]